VFLLEELNSRAQTYRYDQQPNGSWLPPYSCHRRNQIVEGSRLKVESVPGVGAAEIVVAFDPPWTPELITEAGHDFLDGKS